jgi:hypothetical protein
VEHIPAIHAAKVGMRYPALVVASTWDRRFAPTDGQELLLDLTAIAPGRESSLKAVLQFKKTFLSVFAQMLAPGHRVEVVLIEVDRERGDLVASLSANPAWLTWNNGTVRHLAQRIRDTGETVLLPVIADALEEAGCTERDLLARCRQPESDDLDWLVTLLATQE